ncbi:MAG: ATP-dependent DNA helicase RecG, partial [Candidatus Gracilibacteria bacterium]
LMAPTEILAKQHYKTFLKILGQFSLNIQFIAGSTPNKQKKEVIRQMKTGTVDIVIGTHALIQEGIGFKNLGLAIIDEQHRFGVKQREILKKMGSPHLLSMTATPIPRTLAMTIYGDQDLSIIDEMPAGRQKIITRVVPENKRVDAYRWIEDQVKKGRQAFIICPLIDESDVLEVKSVIKEFDFLSEHIFQNLNLGLLHGKLKQEDKDKTMEDFKSNIIHILVSTSVIEVGIDIPNATIMMIEGSERFGLSQLHQFRGRVGRGEHQSYCFLFTGSLSEEGRTRLKSMEKHSSGFKLAEIDLELRGPGEIYGVRQSGIPDLKMASLTDSKTIEKARNAAAKIIAEDPLLKNYNALAAKISEIEEMYVNDGPGKNFCKNFYQSPKTIINSLETFANQKIFFRIHPIKRPKIPFLIENPCNQEFPAFRLKQAVSKLEEQKTAFKVIRRNFCRQWSN